MPSELIYHATVLIEFVSALFLVAAIVLLLSAHKYFRGEITKLTKILLVILSITTLLRFFSAFGGLKYDLEKINFLGSFVRLITAILFIYFSISFLEFAKKISFFNMLTKKTKSQKLIKKALGGKD